MFSGSIVAIVTPMHADGSLDLAAWDRLLTMHLDAGTDGIVVCGSTGEGPTVSESELMQLIERSRARLKDRAALIAGVGNNNTAVSVEAARRVSAAGVDALLVNTPAYNKPSQEGLYRHCEAVAAASSVPVVLYNVPGRTAVDMLPATVARLMKLPRVVAIKEAVPTMERVRELAALGGGRLAVLSGDDATAGQAMLNGARGVISVTANLVPKAMAEMSAAALRGDRSLSEKLDAPLRALHEALFVEGNPIPLKWAMAQLGLIEGSLRLPLTALCESLRPRVRAALDMALGAQLPQAKLA
ncbi:MAG TPA: 4-hydroxy-tetrahydrodipicolinate synthase [Steroidobacteraceae bacterium]|jgi:4-hydroxy-tetrahydrodipicolinate synthase|nr:4-hydroxy-tetrahydrodipicolinate synthase [Steroidobacteraceae bacterium]